MGFKELAGKCLTTNSGPRALADPVVDITDVYAFPSPQQPGLLVLVLNVFPSAEPAALFSDAVDYRFRLRPVTVAGDSAAAFAVGEKEYIVSCRFSWPRSMPKAARRSSSRKAPAPPRPARSCLFRVNDEQGGKSPGIARFRRTSDGSVFL